MAKDLYEPIKLSQTNRYAGYQFHARVRADGMSDKDAFHYVILTVYNWILRKIPAEDLEKPELQIPAPENYATATAETFRPFHLNIGYALDITPLMNEGIWTLRLKQTDTGSDTRKPVNGRFFTTRIGVRLNGKGYTELGIKIDVTDPAETEKELDFAYRPGFVRTLAIQPSVVFEQVRELKYGAPDRINTDDDYRRMLYMLDSGDNQLPLVVFTHYRPGAEKAPSMEEFIKSGGMDALMRPSGGMLFPGMPLPAMQEKKTGKAETAVLPYDADKFGRSAFAYAMTYVLGDKYTERFRSRIKKDFRPGDILLCGTKKFRGGISVISYPGEKEEDREKAYAAALLAAQSYSKHKAPYSFGTVIFEAEARRMEQHARITELVNSGTLEEKEKVSRLIYETELLFEVIANKDEDIRRLNDQKSEAFERGVAFRDAENAALEEENASLKKELTDRQNVIGQMLDKCKRADEVLETLEQMRAIDFLPENNEEVVQFFKTAYRDRLDFTERGEAEASRCKLRPAQLWTVLYTVANKMTDVFRNAQDSLTEDDVVHATGFDVSFREGSMTRKDNNLMRLREDEYRGKKISVEPHLKLKYAKGDEAAHQRLHFCYDREMRKIVIGYLGDHLESAATQYAKKK